jgi:hypothetical protein
METVMMAASLWNKQMPKEKRKKRSTSKVKIRWSRHPTREKHLNVRSSKD